jgi:WD40 repeat protein
MDFSELFKFSGIIKYSPNGKYLANAATYRLVIKNVETLQIIHLFNCMDEISQIEWSPDSSLVLCASYKRATVEVFSIHFPSYKATIDEGAAGVSYARFSPDSRHVLVTADFQLRITIWSLLGNKTTPLAHLKYPKFAGRGLDFTRNDNGKYMALAERRSDCKDYISIIQTETWELVKHFPTQTKHLHDIKWSSCGKYLCVWDSALAYKILVYSADGASILCEYSAYDNALGISSVKWAPNNKLLAVGSYDSKVRLLNSLNWSVISTYSHEIDDSMKTDNTVVFREAAYARNSELIAAQNKTRYVISDLPAALKKKFKLGKPKGVSMMDWSSDNKFLYTRNDDTPNVLWIWETTKLKLSTIITQLEPIKCVEWDPVHPRLALCTSNGRIYIWSKDGCSCVDVPSTNFNVTKLTWSPNGESLVLMDNKSFCCCYFHPEDDEEQ